jgi:hypothetical protein
MKFGVRFIAIVPEKIFCYYTLLIGCVTQISLPYALWMYPKVHQRHKRRVMEDFLSLRSSQGLLTLIEPKPLLILIKMFIKLMTSATESS